MKTYPIKRDDGTLSAFEVTSGWVTFRPLYAILTSVPGVTGVVRQFLKDDRVSFSYNSVPFVVYESFGDSSRYWIGPTDPANYHGDVEPLHNAFRRYRRPMLRVWDFIWRSRSV